MCVMVVGVEKEEFHVKTVMVPEPNHVQDAEEQGKSKIKTIK